MKSVSNRATISDVAIAAGVSKTTVSRYINGRKDLMSEKTGERIQSIIEQLDYKPSDFARILKTKKTNLIGVLVADMSSPFSTAIVVSASDYLTHHGYTPLVADCGNSLEKEEEFIRIFQAKGVAGLLVNTTSYHNEFLISVAKAGLPVVLCDRDVDNYRFNIVTAENRQILYRLVEHLREQGFTRIVFFTQRWENNSSRFIRRQSFLDAVKKYYGYDASNDVYLIDDRDHDPITQLRNLRKRLRPGEIPAVIGVNSVTTVWVFRAMRELGIRIPEEMGLCGPEDWNWKSEMNWSLLIEPNITTFLLPAREIGRQAAEIVLHHIEEHKVDAEPDEVYLRCEMTVRESTLRKKKISEK